ncbi:MAG: ABC transporter ATP-binding protein [Gemmatimonadales bacterium]
MTAIVVRGLTVRYGGRRAARPALDQVSFEVAPGEIVGAVGPNGAGKTSLLAVLAGERRPTHGLSLIAGERAGTPAARRLVGWAPEPPILPRELTGFEWLYYLATHRARNPAERASRIREAIELAQIAEFVERRIGTYSRGMAQRLALAGAVITGPAVLLLDETLSGIDPLVQRDLREALAVLARRGRAMIVASHDLGTVERLATRALVLTRGVLAADVQMHDLLGQRVMELALDGGALAAAAGLCARFPGAIRTGEGVAVPLERGLTPEQVLAACRAQRIAVAATRVRYRALDDLIAATARSA